MDSLLKCHCAHGVTLHEGIGCLMNACSCVLTKQDVIERALECERRDGEGAYRPVV